jgi:hypothetical protein
MALEGLAKAHVVFRGESGLVCDNIDAMDSPLAKEKQALVRKKGLTDAEQEQVFTLEWRMGLYLNSKGEPIVPAKCVMASLTQAARALRLGKHLERGAVQPTASEFPISYDGPRSIKDLWEDPAFRFRTIVNLTPTTPSRSMGVRVRPIFREWDLEMDYVVMLDMMDWSDFTSVLEIAGRQGLCNARRIGYGRFRPEVTRL